MGEPDAEAQLSAAPDTRAGWRLIADTLRPRTAGVVAGVVVGWLRAEHAAS